MAHIYRIVCKRALRTREVFFECIDTINKYNVMNVKVEEKKHALSRSFGAIYGAPGNANSNYGGICLSKESWFSNFNFYKNKRSSLGTSIGISEYFSNYDTLTLMG